jgi:cell division protein FtsQ
MQYPLPIKSVKISSKKNSYRSKRKLVSSRLRWGLHLLLVCLSFAALSAFCVAAYRSLLASPLLQVTRIQVSGYQRLEPQTVIQQAEIPSGVNILSLDLNAVSRRLLNHPWIAAALISREIPDRVRIEIEERQPVALVKGRQFYLMDAQGICFAIAVPSEHTGLPIITGLDSETIGPGHSLPRKFTVLIQDLYRESQLKLPWRVISEIRWNNHTGLSIFTVRGGIQVNLGSGNYGPRIARLEKVLRYLEEKGAQAQLRGVDLSH